MGYDFMKIIDFTRKGNMVKFYLGAVDLETWYGDDWNDRPYEHNAGKVYDVFVSGERIIVFGWDDVVLEPSDGHNNSPYTKEDMIKRKVPCICVLQSKYLDEYEDYWAFSEISGNANVIRFYFGDEMDPADGYDVFDKSNIN